MTAAPRTNGERIDRGTKVAGGVGTMLAIITSVIAIMVWLGFNPTQQLARSEADATYERKAEASIVHGIFGASLEKIGDKLDAMIEASPRAQEKLDGIMKRRKR